MNGETTSQSRYVSTYKMHFKAPGATTGTSNKSGIKTTLRSSHVTHSESRGVERPEAPVFVRPLEDVCVDEGTDFTLRGTIRGTQPIKVSWMHNGEVARFGRSSVEGAEVRFVVRESLPEDAGAYTCLVENSSGKSSSCAAVFIKDYETICSNKKLASISLNSPSKCMGNGVSPFSPTDEVFKSPLSTSPSLSQTPSPVTSPREVIPKKRANSGTVVLLRFEHPPHHLEVKAGEQARLTCSFVGSPPVVSAWIRNKQQIVENSEQWLENSERSCTLVIAEAQSHHSGRYTVIVKDRHSSAQHTVTLSVIERPQPPASCPLVSLVSGSIPVLSWSGPCYDGGSVVLGYVVEVKERNNTNWTEISHNCTSTSYRVTSGLEPQKEYCFRVKAFNAVGVSEPGPESTPLKMDERKKDCRYQAEEAPAAYSHITIDSSHKVTDHYILQEKLGVGKFGHVYKLTHKESGRVCAGKFYKGRRAKEREAARKEIELMNFLHHPKLVQCLGAYDHRLEMVMVMEFIAGGELFERIVDDSFEHTETTSARYMRQILEGVSFMHQQNILHLDLKPENIVCVDTSGTEIKIIDFGLACRLDDNAPLKVMQGTPEFVAPEVINYEPVTSATDMWSIGVICYILLSGESPFQGNSDAETLALVTAAQYEFDEESFDEISEEAKDFISSLLDKAPRRRLTCAEALAHHWMAAFDSEDTASSKSLSKEKMKKFLARQKWKKAGKAMLALKRMALLSKSDSSGSISPADAPPLSPEAEDALQSLEKKMQGPPRFTELPQDQTSSLGSSARLSCHLTGYPDPEVVWLRGDDPVIESSSVEIEYEEDGRCSLVLSNVSFEDASVYTCKATNDHGEAVCSARLFVQRQ